MRAAIALGILLAASVPAVAGSYEGTPVSFSCWTSGSFCLLEYGVIQNSGTACAGYKVGFSTSHGMGPNLAKIGASAIAKKWSTRVVTDGSCVTGPDGVKYPLVRDLRLKKGA